MNDPRIRDRLQRSRAALPPRDWPDGHRDAVWREDLVCGLRGVVALLPEHQVQLLLAEGSVCDMGGAIALALDIDPRVTTVVTYSGDRMDTVYLLNDSGEWVCKSARFSQATTATACSS